MTLKSYRISLLGAGVFRLYAKNIIVLGTSVSDMLLHATCIVCAFKKKRGGMGYLILAGELSLRLFIKVQSAPPEFQNQSKLMVVLTMSHNVKWSPN